MTKSTGAEPKRRTQLTEAQEQEILIATSTFRLLKAANIRSLHLFEHKFAETIRAIKNNRYGKCCRDGCSSMIAEEALGKLEIFCPGCLAKQTATAQLLNDKLVSLRNDLALNKKAGDKELKENSVKKTGNHIADHAITNLNHVLTIIVPGLEKQIRDYEEALERVYLGQYGICMECEEPIPADRLEAKPECLHCVECQTKIEKASGTARIRPII